MASSASLPDVGRLARDIRGGDRTVLSRAITPVSYTHLSAKTLAARYRRAGSFMTKYWTPEVHVAAFALPRFIADVVAKAKPR